MLRKLPHMHTTAALTLAFVCSLIIGGGYVINWPDVDEHLSSEGFLAGAPAPGVISHAR